MNKEMLLMIDSMSRERGLPTEVIFAAVEAALASVAAKRFDEEDVLIRATIDRETGEAEFFRCWEVVADDEEVEMPAQQMPLKKAIAIDESLQVGDVIEEGIEALESGRIGAQQARQVILQKVREAERKKIVENYQNRVNELLVGVVKRVTRDNIILDMGEFAEALLVREEKMPRDMFRVNERVRVLLYEVREERRGPQLLVSRTRPGFLKELFKIEVPEIGEEVIEIKSAARDPGSRAKIAVKTNDGRIDPIGACVGMRGARVQAVSNELGGERIDIVLWDDNPAQLVINAMAPAEVTSIIGDEDSHTMDIAVSEEQLSQAIGRGGQNIRLASQLTGWTLNVMTEAKMLEKHQGEISSTKKTFMEKLEVDAEVAEALAEEGFTTLEEIAYVPPEELAKVEGFDSTIVEELQRRASDILLTQEIATEQELESFKPSIELLKLEGMSEEIALKLAKQKIIERDDLAELSTDELQEMVSLDAEQAAKLIMAARAHWFEEEKK